MGNRNDKSKKRKERERGKSSMPREGIGLPAKEPGTRSRSPSKPDQDSSVGALFGLGVLGERAGCSGRR